jgi:serine/threonine-protein phosphatase PGAM5
MPDSKPPRRLVLLVRHGQYDTESADAGELTRTGREQARRVGLSLAGAKYDSFVSSSLPRAVETANLVAEAIGKRPRRSALLVEGFPTRLRGYNSQSYLEDRRRFEEAYDRFFSPPNGRTVELLVCHGNIIRYFVCRALQLPLSRWTRLGTNHTGVTRAAVREDGEVGLVSYNDVGHLPRRLVT